MFGRLWLYHSCNLLFIVFTIAAAVSSNMGMFIAFRFLMGCAGGAPLVLGGGTIADLISREQRGTAMVGKSIFFNNAQHYRATADLQSVDDGTHDRTVCGTHRWRFSHPGKGLEMELLANCNLGTHCPHS
jgi:hypothetical protein